MLILGLDFETTGHDHVTEVGLAHWDTDLHVPTKVMGFVVNPGDDATWDAKVEEDAKKAGLTREFIAKYGYESQSACRQTLKWVNEADAVMAHNGIQFDKRVLKQWCEKYGLPFPEKLWIDTMVDLPLPAGFTRKLMYMPVDHHLPPNPYPHRAVFDVMSMLQIFNCYPLETILKSAASPMVSIKCLVEYRDREWAKSHGYWPKYDKPEGGKFQHWQMDLKEYLVPEKRAEAEAAGFGIAVIGYLNQ